jgi:hypothetical protein
VWPFKKEKKNTKPERTVLTCTFCGSRNTLLNAFQDGNEPNPVRTWRGRRYLTCRCLDCGRDFYIDEPGGGLPSNVRTDEDMIDEEALQRAEDELKRQTDAEDDRMFK